MNDDLIRAANLLDVGEYCPCAACIDAKALAARLRALAAGLGEPVAWRKMIDSRYELLPRWHYSEDQRAGYAPLYTTPQAAAPRAEAVADKYPDDLGILGDARELSERCGELAKRLARAAPPANTLRDQMSRFVSDHPGTREAAATELWLRQMPIPTAPPADQGRDEWKLVPVEPTDAMRRAAQVADMYHSDHEDWLHEEWEDHHRIWKALLSAAPIPPDAGEGK